MLGFTTLSQAPLSQAVTLAEATITLSGCIATFSQGTFSFDAEANFTLPAGAVSNFDAGAVQGKGGADTAVTGTTAQFGAGTLTAKGPADAKPTGVSVTFEQGTGFSFIGEANFTLSSATSLFTAGDVAFNADATTATTGTTATFTAGSPSATVSVRGRVEGVFALLRKNLPLPVATSFPYEDFADEYSRTRTVYLLSYDVNRAVFVTPENTTVLLNPIEENTTVHVNPQNTTVYLKAESQKTTVYVTR